MKRFRWIVFLGVLLVVSVMVQDFLMDRVYSISMYKHNSRHFAWTYWLAKYAAAAKTPHGVFG